MSVIECFVDHRLNHRLRFISQHEVEYGHVSFREPRRLSKTLNASSRDILRNVFCLRTLALKGFEKSLPLLFGRTCFTPVSERPTTWLLDHPVEIQQVGVVDNSIDELLRFFAGVVQA